jgi:hypothetical protein
MRWFLVAISIFWMTGSLHAQDSDINQNSAGYVPVISGAVGYIYNVNGGVPALSPQINPVLLVPFGPHVLLESHADFIGFFQRQHQTSGPYTGKIFKTVESAQLDWLANTHLIAVAGRYLIPFGLYNERLTPLWIHDLQDAPITAAIGTLPGESADGIMLRGVLRQTPSYSIQYSSYFSANSSVNQLEAARSAGGDASIYLTDSRLEVGGSYQRYLQDHEMNSFATYASWQPFQASLDVKFEYDHSYNGYGYWLQGAYFFSQTPIKPAFLKRMQLVGRAQQFRPLNGGGNNLPQVDTDRLDLGLNYYIRDNLRLVSSYGRQFNSPEDANIWDLGFTYRFVWPLWPERKK